MLFLSFTAFMDFSSASNISDCCRCSLQRAGSPGGKAAQSFWCWWITAVVRHTRGVQGWPQHQDNTLAVFWKPCLTLKGSFPPIILIHPISIPAAFPWPSTCHSPYSLTPEPSTLPIHWICLGSGFVPLREACPTSPNCRLQKIQHHFCRFAGKQR